MEASNSCKIQVTTKIDLIPIVVVGIDTHLPAVEIFVMLLSLNYLLFLQNQFYLLQKSGKWHKNLSGKLVAEIA